MSSLHLAARLGLDGCHADVAWRAVDSPSSDHRGAHREHADRLHTVGRELADDCLRRLGSTGRVIGARGRRPTWPIGYGGSISHARRMVVAAAVDGATGPTRTGIDVEEVRPLPDELVTSLLSPAEQTRFAHDRVLALVAVAAKEAAFKAVGGDPLDVWRCEVTLADHDVVVSCHDGRLLSGRWTDWFDHVVVIVRAVDPT